MYYHKLYSDGHSSYMQYNSKTVTQNYDICQKTMPFIQRTYVFQAVLTDINVPSHPFTYQREAYDLSSSSYTYN